MAGIQCITPLETTTIVTYTRRTGALLVTTKQVNTIMTRGTHLSPLSTLSAFPSTSELSLTSLTLYLTHGGGELLLLDAPTSSHHEGQYTTPCCSPCVTLARRGELSSVNHRCDSLGYHVLSYHSHPLSAISLFFRSPLFTSMCDARVNANK